MSLKTIYSVDDIYDVHAEADIVFLDVPSMEEPSPLTLDQVGDLINALEMAYTDAVDLKEAADERATRAEGEAAEGWQHLGYTTDDDLAPGAIFAGDFAWTPEPVPIFAKGDRVRIISEPSYHSSGGGPLLKWTLYGAAKLGDVITLSGETDPDGDWIDETGDWAYAAECLEKVEEPIVFRQTVEFGFPETDLAPYLTKINEVVEALAYAGHNID